MKITDVIQRTPPWERWRAQGVTASEAAIILGRSPYKTPWRLWAERTGIAREADLSANPHVQRGNALEDAARRAFEERHDTLLLPLCGESEEHPGSAGLLRRHRRRRLPGGAQGPGGAHLRRGRGEDRRRRPPSGSTGRRSSTSSVWPEPSAAGWCSTGDRSACWSFPSTRDEAFLNEELVPACLAFWEAVAKRKEPPRDPARDLYVPVGEELDHWSVLAGEYRDLLREKAGLDARLKESKEDLDRVEVALIGMMGGFLAAEAAGVKVTRYLQNGAIDYGSALKAPAPRARCGRAGDLSAQGVRTGPHHAAR